MLSTERAQLLVSSLGEAQKRWWNGWFDALGHFAVSRGAEAAGLMQEGFSAWRTSVVTVLELQQEAAQLLGAQQFAQANGRAALAARSEALAGAGSAELKLGSSASLEKVLTDADIVAFAGLSGDVNPLHLSDAYAAQTRFGARIAHGMLAAGLVSAVLGTKLPGPGTIYLSQTLQFRAPVFVGERVKATVTVVDKREDKPIYTLSTVCSKDDGTVVLEGEAVILYEPT